MKKFLLLAALVAAFVGNAQELQLTKLWEVGAPVLANTRQGIGLDGKYLINNKVEGIVYQYTEENVSNFGVTGATAAWPAIAKDDVGNVIVRVDNSWPGSFKADTTIFKIFPAGGGDPIAVEGNIFADFDSENGRMDYLGHAEGNLMEEGAIYIVTSNSTGVMRVPFVEGEIDGDHINLIPVDGAASFANSGAYVDAWDAADGTKHYLLHWRGIVPYDMTLNEDMDQFTATAITTVNRANLTGYKCFARDGKNYIAYSLKPADRNYGDGFAIMEIGGEEPVFQVEDTGKDLNNGGICTQWLDIDGNYLFQYAGNQYIACYEFAGSEPEELEITEAYLVGTFNDWNQTEEGGRIAFEDVDGVLTAAGVELEAGAEFKVIVPKEDGGWTWLGGEDANGVGYFLFTNELLGTPVQLIDGANFRIENAGTYNLEILASQLDKAASYALRITEAEPNAIETIATDNADNTWYNLQGVKFNGQPSVPGIYINNGKKVIVK